MTLYVNHEDAEIRRAAAALTVLVEQAFKRSEQYPKISPLDFAVMRYLAQLDEEGVTTAIVTENFGLTTPSGVTLVQRLVDNGFASYEPPKRHQRGRQVRLTPEGWKALEGDPLQKAFGELLPNIGEEACRALFEAIIPADWTQERWRELKLGLDFWR
jgi:DNA-binding MarR family transcriptional regulator